MYTTLAALTAGLAATVSAFDCNGAYFSFYNRAGPSLSYQRLDPALFPGQESPHLHSFDGGNGLGESMSYETTQGSSCTTARIKPDKSLYWRPTLYWNGNNTGFYRVPDQYLKIYYKFGDAGNVRANVTEFPKDFRMIAGNPFLRSDDGTNSKGPNVQWSCKGENYANTDATGFPKGFTSCPNGFASQITFPACWNGNDMDPAKPTAHMAWPTASGTGINACPEGFKHTRFPTIFIEFWYDVSAFDNQYSADDTPWVLSNGDPTGYGFHADFLNGWETGVLAKATAETGYCNCGCGCGTDQMKTCFGADNVNDDSDEEFKSCSASAEYPDDDKSPLDKLPGCNPIQSGPGLATQATGAGCTAAPASNGGSAAASATAQTSEAASSVGVVDVSSSLSSALPTISVSIPNKGYGDATYGFATPSTALVTAASSSSTVTYYQTTALSDGGSLGLVFDDTATDSATLAPPASSVATTVSPGETEDCKAPVYVTITPTVYVTAGAENVGNSTDCASTYYTTFTNKVTVTVQPTASRYKHKGHAAVHSH
ncbi:hypothetical protein BDV96DRAFT_611965 [Lophiotrema nucula]|uniref:DUF1996 domain-containing protein n=1 Tax=Lophiotrema nucula TaxID=690887 RepID=A0A6A5ZBZ4_9PLEO|nr:hypothetical protein BDV96DRAFT_611965 [Lophiotrema nucula]